MPPQPPSLVTPHALAALPGIVAAFSTRHGGGSAPPFDSLNVGLNTDDRTAQVDENRRVLLEALGFAPGRLAMAGQVHGDRVEVVAEPGLYPGCDALVTDTPGLVLGITAADCAVVLLADAEARVVGACHAGWRGTVARIVHRTIDEMGALGAAPGRMQAFVSPCISVDSFEVGPEVAARFASPFVHRHPGREKPHVDLKGALSAQLAEAGVPAGAVEVSDYCTFGRTDLFFSHRAEHGTTGRMMGLVAMEETRP